MADTKDDNAKVKTLTDEVDKAEAQLTQSMYATAQLHVLWRSHLFRMSLLVLAIALSQCRTPTMECIKNIKVWTRFNATPCFLFNKYTLISLFPNATPRRLRIQSRGQVVSRLRY
jgi:hypothetical protein